MTKARERNLVRTGPMQDTWLTPLKLLAALGPFDLDPCCPPVMPWATAARMVGEAEDGLAVPWAGRVWLNPPYSSCLPWIERLAAHGDGVLLVSAKSPETRWGQAALRTRHAHLFLAGRLRFCTVDGVPADGAWLPNLPVAYGAGNVQALRRLAASTEFSGELLVNDRRMR